MTVTSALPIRRINVRITRSCESVVFEGQGTPVSHFATEKLKESYHPVPQETVSVAVLQKPVELT